MENVKYPESEREAGVVIVRSKNKARSSLS